MDGSDQRPSLNERIEPDTDI